MEGLSVESSSMWERTYEKRIEKIVEGWLEKPELGWLIDFNKLLPEAEIYLVGGCLRDAGLDKECQDLDFIVRKIESPILEKTLSSLGQVVLVGKNFGVFKFRPQGYEDFEFDLALPRTDSAFGTGGYKDVETQSDPDLPIETDLARRDFTVNALAYNLKSKKLLDPYHGLKDLKEKTIQTVGEPKERFQEDYSRLLRALRFATSIDGKISTKTSEVLKDFLPRLNERKNKVTGEVILDQVRQVLPNDWEYILPGELVASEIVKTLTSNPVKFWDLYQEYEVWSLFVPDFTHMKSCEQTSKYHAEGNVANHMRLVLSGTQEKLFKNILENEKILAEVLVAALFHDVSKPSTHQLTSTGHHFYGHEQVGAKLWSDLQKILPFATTGLDTVMVQKLIGNHMQINDNVYEMRKETILKYFGGETGRNQLLLGVLDVGACWRGRFKRQDFSKIKFILGELEKMIQEGYILPAEKLKSKKPLINGQEIMRLWNLSGNDKDKCHWIGWLKAAAWEAELAGDFKDKKIESFDERELQKIITNYLTSEQRKLYNNLF